MTSQPTGIFAVQSRIRGTKCWLFLTPHLTETTEVARAATYPYAVAFAWVTTYIERYNNMDFRVVALSIRPQETT